MGLDETGDDPEKLSPREKTLLESLRGCYTVGEKGLMLDEEIIACIWPKTVNVVWGKMDSGKGGKKIAPTKGKGKR